jgi:hypothetical protein
LSISAAVYVSSGGGLFMSMDFNRFTSLKSIVHQRSGLCSISAAVFL